MQDRSAMLVRALHPWEILVIDDLETEKDEAHVKEIVHSRLET
jgi:hypothetical protein